MTNEQYYSPSSSPREKTYPSLILNSVLHGENSRNEKGEINVTSTTYARKEIPMKLLIGYSYYKILARDQLYDYTNAV